MTSIFWTKFIFLEHCGPGGPEPTWNLTDQLTLFEPGWVEFALLPVPQIQKDIYTSVLSFKLLNCHCYNARIRRSIDTPMEVSQPDQLKRFVYFFGCTIERRYGDWCGPVVPGDAGVPHAMACHGTPRFFFLAAPLKGRTVTDAGLSSLGMPGCHTVSQKNIFCSKNRNLVWWPSILFQITIFILFDIFLTS